MLNKQSNKQGEYAYFQVRSF